jgi:hypothetical protein
MPTRSRRARGAVAPCNTFRLRASRPIPAAIPAPARGPSPRPPACGRGRARGGRALRPPRRRAATSPGRRRAAGTPVAQVRRAIIPAARGRPTKHNSGRRRPVPAPAARRPSPRRQRAEGDERRVEGAASMVCAGQAGGWRTICRLRLIRERRRAPTSPGHPPRSLHARGAVAPRDTSRMPRLGGITRFAQPNAPRPVPAPAAPLPVAATAGVRMGMRAARNATAPRNAGGRPRHRDADARLHACGAGAPDDDFPDGRSQRGRVAITRIPRPLSAPPPPAARAPSPRPPARGWGCARGGGRAQERRRAATSPGCRRAACTPVAQVRRGIRPGAGVGWIA